MPLVLNAMFQFNTFYLVSRVTSCISFCRAWSKVSSNLFSHLIFRYSSLLILISSFFLLEYLFFLFLWDFIPRRYWFFLRHFLNQFLREFCHTLNHIHFFQRHKYPISIRGRKFSINSCALSEKLEKLEDPQNPTAVF